MFDLDTIHKRIGKLQKNPPIHYVSVCHEETNALCLIRCFNGKSTVLLSKSEKDKSKFDEMVENLSIYFDAQILINP